MKRLIKRYGHAIPVFIYFVIYLVWFSIIEDHSFAPFTFIHMKVDDVIPFCEWFIIPYIMWFGYVFWIVAYTFLNSKHEYYKVCNFLISGMTIFLIVSTLWPSVHHLRPGLLPRHNILTQAVKLLYLTDTPTNIWPSIHVYNSIGVYIAVANSSTLGKKKYVKNICFVLSWLIILSTMFLKQHSMFDVITAFAMAGIFYLLIYKYEIIISIRYYIMSRKWRKKHI